MISSRFIGILTLMGGLAGFLAGQVPTFVAPGLELEDVVPLLKRFQQESATAFATLKGEPMATRGGKLWKSTVGYPPVIDSLTRIYAPDGPLSRSYISIKITERTGEGALARLDMLRAAFEEALPDWEEREPPLTADDIQFHEDNGSRSVRSFEYHRAREPHALMAFLKLQEDLATHRFTTYVEILEDRP